VEHLVQGTRDLRPKRVPVAARKQQPKQARMLEGTQVQDCIGALDVYGLLPLGILRFLGDGAFLISSKPPFLWHSQQSTVADALAALDTIQMGAPCSFMNYLTGGIL
jgi:hypothetical protein